MVGQKVDTPLGRGIVQGRYALTDGNGAVVEVRQLVRIVINDETVQHLSDGNCLTPKATSSALFTFPMEVCHEQ